MCGITGFVDLNSTSSKEVLENMTAVLEHRGPDDWGAKVHDFPQSKVGLGHRRLSILDLSMAGHQPMSYKSFEIVYNGEVYNFQEIKKELVELGHEFLTGTDSEVILHAYEQWGDQCVDRFIGMFAFAILDPQKNKLILFRDRPGVKPLYYYHKNGLFLFGSELKSLHQHPAFEKIINKTALKSFFDLLYIPAPLCIFEDTFKLQAGHILEISLEDGQIETKKYWDSDDAYKKPKHDLSYNEAKGELEQLLKSAFSYRMVADVPVGVFLSGGYDSTAVAAILQANSKEKLKTFTIGFKEGNNEAPAAKETANYLGTDHTEYYCEPSEARNIIPDLPYYYDEPFADSSAIPTMLVSRLAKKKVSVALSADGGDELFAGYGRYPGWQEKSQFLNRIPNPLKRVGGTVASYLSQGVPKSQERLKHSLHGISKSLSDDNMVQIRNLYKYAQTMPEYYTKNILNFDYDGFDSNFDKDVGAFDNEIDLLTSIDYKVYLQDDILTKVDRATMAVSLEGREPLLDHRLQEFAARLPANFKMKDGYLKYILKDIVHQYVPENLMNRPKSGFSLPIYSWLRNELKYLLDEYLSEKELKKHGLFQEENVLDLVEKFKQNKLHYSPLIWKLLMFQMWYKRWME